MWGKFSLVEEPAGSRYCVRAHADGMWVKLSESWAALCVWATLHADADAARCALGCSACVLATTRTAQLRQQGARRTHQRLRKPCSQQQHISTAAYLHPAGTMACTWRLRR